MGRFKLILPLFLCLFLFKGIPSAGAAIITVTTTVDEFDTGTDCSLRQAVEASNSGAFGPNTGNCLANSTGSLGNNIINLAANTTYNLSICFTPETPFCGNNDADDLDVCNNDVQIVGGNGTVIDASGLVPCGGRILEVTDSFGVITVTLSNLTVQNGDAVTSSEAGGGLLNHAILNLNNVTVTENQGDAEGGGGIFNDGTMTIQNSVISNNSTNGAFGAGILHTSIGSSSPGPLTIDNTTISGNFFTNAASGGGGIALNENATISNSTISGNGVSVASSPLALEGGGVYYAGGLVNIINTTISGNSAERQGGGIWVGPLPIPQGTGIDSLSLFNVTVANNDSPGTSGQGGGIFVNPQFPNLVVNLNNTLIATNQAIQGPDCFASVNSDQGFNLLGIDDGNCTGLVDGTNGDQVGSIATPLDPLIDPLASNGGSTDTHELILTGTTVSPAIDQGNPAGCLDQNGNVLNQDQRGLTRPVNALDLPTTICDIGAFEVQVEPTPSPIPPPIITGCLEGSGFIGGNSVGCGGCSLNPNGGIDLLWLGMILAVLGLSLGFKKRTH